MGRPGEELSEAMNRMTLSERIDAEKELPLPVRPTPGTLGQGIQVYANYYEINQLPVGEIVMYDVVITPDVLRAVKRNIFNEMEKAYRSSQFGDRVLAYDGQHNLYSLGPLPKDNYTLDLKMPERPGSQPRPGREPRGFQIKLRKVSSVNIASIKDFMEGRQKSTPYDVITALEVILRQPLITTNIVCGRSLYNEQGATKISGGLEVWKGFFFSIRPGFGRLLLNVDITATAFYSSGPVLHIMADALRISRSEKLGKLDDREQRTCESFLRNLKVEVTHRPNVKRRYRVLGFTSSSTRNTMFTDDEGKEISVAAYFAAKYKIELREPDLPCLVVGSKERSIFIPPECANIASGQKFPRKLNEEQTSDMIRIANKRPDDRFGQIHKSPELIRTAEGYLKAFGLGIGKDLVQVSARVLQAPKITYGVPPNARPGTDTSVTPRDGTWNLRDRAVERGVVIDSWAVLNFARVSPKEVEDFVRELCVTCNETGVPFKATLPPIISAREGQDVSIAVHEAFSAAKQAHSGVAAKFVLVVLPSTDSGLYGEVKRASDTQIGLLTQCMQAKHMRRPNKQYCANLALKINIKCGGINSSIGKAVGFIAERPTMVLGADVTHPGIGERDKPSIAAVVASLDIRMSRYAAAVRVQDSRQEIIVEMRQMFVEHCQSFRAANKNMLPERVLFYRDGVSEGQFGQVLKHELDAIRRGARDIDSNYNPTITMVLVQKRHHTRFVASNPRDADRSGNVPAGTVVDTTVTHPTQFDFYLCSHAGLQGTSRPAHYHVVYDDHKFTADALQSLSFNLCFTFARCTRSVSIVTPAYYAHLVAFRARFHFDPRGQQHGGDVAKAFCPVVPELRRQMYFM